MVAVAGGDVATALDQQVKDGEVVSGRRPVNRAIAIPVAVGKVLFWRNKREKESKHLWRETKSHDLPFPRSPKGIFGPPRTTDTPTLTRAHTRLRHTP